MVSLHNLPDKERRKARRQYRDEYDVPKYLKRKNNKKLDWTYDYNDYTEEDYQQGN